MSTSSDLADLVDRLESPRFREMCKRLTGVDVAASHALATMAILRAYKITSWRVENALNDLGLTFSRFEVLWLLSTADRGRMSFKELGQESLLHPATVTYTLDGLEAENLVVRRPDPTDRRAVIAEITRDGRRIMRSAIPRLQKIMFGLGGLSEEDAGEIAVFLAKISHDPNHGPASRERKGTERPPRRKNVRTRTAVENGS